MKIGVLSDTHGHLDPRVLELLAGVEHILHAGDLGTPMIAFELEQLAPFTAVLGNNDLGLAGDETAVVRLAGRKILVHHIVEPYAADSAIHRRIAREDADVVVFGHTHRSFWEKVGWRWFLNPGYAGAKRFQTPRSLALLQLDGPDTDPRVEFREF